MLIIGRKDRAELPLLGVTNVPVKIDSGAYSCSIHCQYIQEECINDETVLGVVFFDENSTKYSGEKIYFKSFKNFFLFVRVYSLSLNLSASQAPASRDSTARPPAITPSFVSSSST